MHRAGAFFLLLISTLVAAQSAPPPTHAPSGGTREMIASIYIPPLTNAPFSATVVAELTRTLEDGGTITVYNQRHIMRDSAGRVFQERRTFVPRNGERQPELTRLEISDPTTHQKYFCEVQRRACQVHRYSPPKSFRLRPPGPLGDGKGDLTREDLGSNLVNGIEAVGTRETVVLNAGVAGNDRPLSLMREFWYSPRLGINLIEKRVDPRSGTQMFTVSDVALSEPDPQSFAVPAGFTVVKPPAKQ